MRTLDLRVAVPPRGAPLTDILAATDTVVAQARAPRLVPDDIMCVFSCGVWRCLHAMCTSPVSGFVLESALLLWPADAHLLCRVIQETPNLTRLTLRKVVVKDTRALATAIASARRLVSVSLTDVEFDAGDVATLAAAIPRMREFHYDGPIDNHVARRAVIRAAVNLEALTLHGVGLTDADAHEIEHTLRVRNLDITGNESTMSCVGRLCIWRAYNN